MQTSASRLFKKFLWGGDAGYPPVSWFVGVVIFIPVGVLAMATRSFAVGAFLLLIGFYCGYKTIERMRS